MNGRDTSTAGRVWTDCATTHIDVRGLPPPQPLIRIIQLAQRLPDDDAVLIVHHDRDPVWLYPELLQIGWWAEIVDGDPGEVRLRIVRVAPQAR
jgi:Uncharacterized conserved protein (DUF2249)